MQVSVICKATLIIEGEGPFSAVLLKILFGFYYIVRIRLLGLFIYTPQSCSVRSFEV